MTSEESFVKKMLAAFTVTALLLSVSVMAQVSTDKMMAYAHHKEGHPSEGTSGKTLTASNDATAPLVQITQPTSDSSVVVDTTVAVQGTASDSQSGIKIVYVKIDENAYSTATPKSSGDWSSWSINVAISSTGSHKIVAKAYDNAGNYQWSTVDVNVVNTDSSTSPAPSPTNDTDTIGDTGEEIDNSLPVPLRTVTATSLSSLMNAISLAKPGDHIILRDGTYDTTEWLRTNSATSMMVRAKGTLEAPIVIRSETIGGATIKGPAGLQFSSASNLIIQGFRFMHSQDNSEYSGDIAIRCNACENVRFTRNHFELPSSDGSQSDWLGITSKYSKNNRIDHNTFVNKKTLGVFVLLLGSDGVMTQNNKIDHNYFARWDTYVSNGGECLRIGNSILGPRPAYTTVEYNLFEECNGDREAVTVKSSNNVLKHNTFRNNEGSLVLRHGNNNIVEGNIFIDNIGGVRMYGHGHKIINNYFEGNSGGTVRQTIVVGTGTVESDLSVSNSEHSQSRNVLIAYNTLVDNTSHLVIGYGSGSYSPSDITIVNNIIKGDSGVLVNLIKGTNLTWQGNILHGTATKGNIPSSGYSFLDPILGMESDGVYRLKIGSPAIDMAGSSYSTEAKYDMDGQPRIGSPDCGADERSSETPTNKPLKRTDVGPAST